MLLQLLSAVGVLRAVCVCVCLIVTAANKKLQLGWKSTILMVIFWMPAFFVMTRKRRYYDNYLIRSI